MLVLSVLFFLFTSLSWSAGYQEEKLLDTSSYSSDDLKKKADEHKIEIQVLEDQIKDLKADSDWMILKINQIRDSGRIVPANLKTALRHKEDKTKELAKTKKRLESLVKYYSALEKSKQDGTFESIVGKKIAALESKTEKPEKKRPLFKPRRLLQNQTKLHYRKICILSRTIQRRLPRSAETNCRRPTKRWDCRTGLKLSAQAPACVLKQPCPFFFPPVAPSLPASTNPFSGNWLSCLNPTMSKFL